MIQYFTSIGAIRHTIKIISLFIISTLSLQAFGQVTVVTGKVTGSNGEVLAGATVQVKGSKKGTATDNFGNFSLSVPNPNSTLVISSAGFTKQEVTVNGRTNIP